MVLVGVDTLRADHLGCYGYGRDTSPHLDRLAQSSTLFAKCFSTSAWTAPAWASLFTGVLPSQHSLLRYPTPGVVKPELPTLAEVLQHAGYLTAGFHGGGFVDAGFGLGRGFLEYSSYGMRLGDSLEQSRRWMQANRRHPFFIFWHGYDCHMPYDPPAQFDWFDPTYRGAYDVSKLYKPDGTLPADPADHEHVVAKYDAEIAYADSMVGRLLHELESLQLMERTLIIVVSDHGEEFLEHGGYDHTRTLYDELIRVPLLVRFFDSPQECRTSGLVSLEDLLPMVCEWVGLEAPACHGRSASQLRHSPRESLIAETGYAHQYLQDTEGLPWQHKRNRPTLLRCVRTNSWKLLLDDQDRPHQLFDLAADPQESSDLLEVNEGVAEALETAFHAGGSGVTSRELDIPQGDGARAPDVQERLRALGYL